MYFNFNRADFHCSWQGLKLAYARSVVLFLAINIIKKNYWNDWIKDTSLFLWKKMNLIISNLINIAYIMTENKNKLLTNIKVNEDDLQQWVYKNIIKDKLKFKYKWEAFSANDHFDLITYISKQGKNWVFDKTALNKLFVHFNNRFSKEILRRKVFKLGIDFYPN